MDSKIASKAEALDFQNSMIEGCVKRMNPAVKLNGEVALVQQQPWI
jgi:hypothetical protein